MRQFISSLASGLVCLALGVSSASAEPVSFIKDVAPILLQRCAGCHGPIKAEGDFRLHTFEFLMLPGASGEDSVAPGEANGSTLFARLVEEDESLRMPQLDDPFTPEELAVVRAWIDQGAQFDGRDPRTSLKSQLPPLEHREAPEVYRAPVPADAVAFLEDGARVAVSGHREITIWDAESGTLVDRIGRLPERIHAVIPIPDSQRMLVGGGSPGDYGELALIDRRDGTRQVLGTFDDVVLSTAISHDGTKALASSADRSVRCYSVADGALLWESRLHFDWATSVAFSYDDQFAVTGSKDFTIKVMKAESGELFTTYKGHQRNLGQESGRFEIFAIAAAQDSPLTFSAGEGKTIRVWEPVKAQQEDGSAADMEIRFYKAGHTQFLAHGSKRPVYQLHVQGDHLFAATGDGTIQQFSISTLKPVRTYSGLKDWALSLDVSADGSRLAAGALNGEVRIWNTETGDQIAAFLAAPGDAPANITKNAAADAK